jgi:hypothetical protein
MTAESTLWIAKTLRVTHKAYVLIAPTGATICLRGPATVF